MTIKKLENVTSCIIDFLKNSHKGAEFAHKSTVSSVSDTSDSVPIVKLLQLCSGGM